MSHRIEKTLYRNKKNLDAFRLLVSILKDEPHNVRAYVGAGLSATAKVPTWSSLLDKLHVEARNRTPQGQQRIAESLMKAPDSYWRAEVYQKSLDYPKSGTFKELVASHCKVDSTGKDSLAIKHACRLPVGGIITTNYDTLLEKSQDTNFTEKVVWGSKRRPNFTELKKPKTIIYLHGCHTEPETIILSDSDYTDFYVISDANTRLLNSLLANFHILFLGCSLEDDSHVLRVLQEVQTLGMNKDKNYALMPLPSSKDIERHFHESDLSTNTVKVSEFMEIQRKKYFVRYGINLIYFKPPSGNPKDRFGNFTPLLEYLASLKPAGISKAAKAPKTEDLSSVTPLPTSVEKSAAVLTKIKAKGSAKDDPQKGRFGGLSTRGDFSLAAKVSAIDEDWFQITLEIKAPPSNQEAAHARFHLHDTFSPATLTVSKKKSSSIKTELTAFGAFTVGAEVLDKNRELLTVLELDLSQDPKFPSDFRSR